MIKSVRRRWAKIKFTRNTTEFKTNITHKRATRLDLFTETNARTGDRLFSIVIGTNLNRFSSKPDCVLVKIKGKEYSNWVEGWGDRKFTFKKSTVAIHEDHPDFIRAIDQERDSYSNFNVYFNPIDGTFKSTNGEFL